MKTWIKILIVAVLASAVCVMSVLYAESHKHVKTLKAQVTMALRLMYLLRLMQQNDISTMLLEN